MRGITELVNQLKTAQKPLIYMGNGARQYAGDVIQFATVQGIPIQTTWPAIDLIWWDHPLFTGRPGSVATRGANKIIQECDLLICIGARIDEATVGYNYDLFAPNAYKVMVDIDKGEAEKIPNLDLFIQADISDFLQQFIGVTVLGTSNNWAKDIEIGSLEGTGGTYDLVDKLSDHLTPADVLVIGTSNTAVPLFCAGFRNKKYQRVMLSSCGLGSMGATIPFAIGVALASGKRVVTIDGDGSFTHNTQELQVVRSMGLNITMFIINNNGYSSIRNSTNRAFGRTPGDAVLPDVKRVAKAYGMLTSQYNSKYPMETFLQLPTPHVIEVQVSRFETIAPRVIFGEGDFSNMYPYEGFKTRASDWISHIFGRHNRQIT